MNLKRKNFDAFPGFKMPIKAMIAEGDLVSVYFIFVGKHTGTPFAGVPATGKSVKFSLMILLRIADVWMYMRFSVSFMLNTLNESEQYFS